MRKLMPIFMAIGIGSLCALFLFKKVAAETPKLPITNVVAIQIGVFTKKDNALRMQENYGGKVFIDDELYRVYYAILEKEENISFICNLLKNKGISYYLKKINVDEKLLAKSSEYENIMIASNEETKPTINESILKIYEGVM